MKFRHLHLFVFLIISFGLLCASSYLIWAKAPETAKIAFASHKDGDIYIMNADGSEQFNLTRHASRNRDPVWSPNGQQILFSSDRQDRIWDLFIMDADGENIRKIFKNTAVRRRATWSPDGRMITYWRENELAIYTATIDGAQEKRLVQAGEDGGYPKWSPDGTEIAYILARKPPVGTSEIRIINLQTHLQRTLLPKQPLLMYSVAWSPDGDKIAFYWINLDIWNVAIPWVNFWDNGAIYTVRLDGSELRKIVPGPELDLRPLTWSPNGDELIYGKGKQLFKIDLDSHTKTQLTHDGVYFDPDWFAPGQLVIQPNAELLTTIWGQLKLK